MKNKKVGLLVKLGPKGRIVLKKEIRKALGVKKDDLLKAKLINKKLLIEPFDWNREVEEIEGLARKISRKWPKGLSAAEAVRRERE